MDLAKPGLIKQHCAPNALSSCQEYSWTTLPPPAEVGEQTDPSTSWTVMEELRPERSANVWWTRFKANKRDV